MSARTSRPRVSPTQQRRAEATDKGVAMDRNTYMLVKSETELQRYRRTRKLEPWQDGPGDVVGRNLFGRVLDQLTTLLRGRPPVHPEQQGSIVTSSTAEAAR